MFWKKTKENEHGEENLIIHRPEKLSKVKKRTEISFTLIGWGIWFFFCRPLVILALWVGGVDFFYGHMIKLGGLRSLTVFFKSYVFVLIMIVVLIRGWNWYNIVRFRGKEKRTWAPDVEAKEFDQLYQLPYGAAEEIQELREVTVDFDENRIIELSNPERPDQKFKGRHPEY